MQKQMVGWLLDCRIQLGSGEPGVCAQENKTLDRSVSTIRPRFSKWWIGSNDNFWRFSIHPNLSRVCTVHSMGECFLGAILLLADRHNHWAKDVGKKSLSSSTWGKSALPGGCWLSTLILRACGLVWFMREAHAHPLLPGQVGSMLD